MITLLLLGGLCCLLILAFASLRWPIFMAIAIFFTLSMDYLGRLGLGVLTVNNMLKSLFILVFLVRLIVGGGKLWVPRHLLALLPFMLIAGIGSFHSPNYVMAVQSFGRMLFVWVFTILLANIVSEERHLRWLMHTMAAAALIIAGICAIQAMNFFVSGPLAIHSSSQAFARECA